jgi:hypothetical protein
MLIEQTASPKLCRTRMHAPLDADQMRTVWSSDAETTRSSPRAWTDETGAV